MIAERSVLPGRVRVSVRLSDGAEFLCVLQPQHTPAIATAHDANMNLTDFFICWHLFYRVFSRLTCREQSYEI